MFPRSARGTVHKKMMAGCNIHLFVRFRTDLWVTGGEHSPRVNQHGAPMLGVFLCHWHKRISHSEEPTVIRQEDSDLPLSTLTLQGWSKLLLTSWQPARVFQLLAKPAAVASGTPLSFRKSSAWLLLKLPHRPANRHHHVNDHTWAFILLLLFAHFPRRLEGKDNAASSFCLFINPAGSIINL